MTKKLSDCTPEEVKKLRASTAQYREKTRVKRAVKEAERHKHKYATDPAYRARKDMQAKEARLRKLYGLSSFDQATMLSTQGGKCPICGSHDPRGRNWHTDHCHETGKVRAMLCGPCNVFVGRIEKNPNLLANALRYIESHKNVCD
jgi:DNA repair exonuclease SbcCD ATPase subunit